MSGVAADAGSAVTTTNASTQSFRMSVLRLR
jgi:hypothetical protein